MGCTAGFAIRLRQSGRFRRRTTTGNVPVRNIDRKVS